jgi:ribonuclease VapC
MFIDASALVSILTKEEDHERLARRLDAAERLITSAIAIYEAALAIARKKGLGIDVAGREVGEFLQRVDAGVMPIDNDAARLALVAQSRYGKSIGHPARLTMGDCFAYAMAKQHRVPLLCNGDDFAQTDLA